MYRDKNNRKSPEARERKQICRPSTTVRWRSEDPLVVDYCRLNVVPGTIPFINLPFYSPQTIVECSFRWISAATLVEEMCLSNDWKVAFPPYLRWHLGKDGNSVASSFIAQLEASRRTGLRFRRIPGCDKDDDKDIVTTGGYAGCRSGTSIS